MISFEDLRKTIEQAEDITVFRHVHPDADAYGSAFALKQFIKDNWPQKHIYALGHETLGIGIFEELDAADDETVKRSLAIITDCGSAARIDDDRWQSAADTLKIDHHLPVESYAAKEYVDETASSSCEILAQCFLSYEDLVLSEKTALYLYQGMVSDSLGFTTGSTSSDTLLIASALAAKGIDLAEIHHALYDTDLATYRFISHLRSIMRIHEGNTAYAILSLQDLKSLQISGPHARDYVNTFGGIREIGAWALFTERDDGSGLYDGSLRAKYADVNEPARKYHGGGHLCASGCKLMSLEDIEDCVAMMSANVRKTESAHA
ncbi:MAG: bifunctional oligoribonuclease/PAP phosphatase NrnA [Solobacterium sp.]|nr:bifunctional oligoribonuclease/PAP phosphatase NrnA [Solobacterium sp.]